MKWPWIRRANVDRRIVAAAEGQRQLDQADVDDANRLVGDAIAALRLAHATIEEHQRRVPRLTDVRVEAMSDGDTAALARLVAWLEIHLVDRRTVSGHTTSAGSSGISDGPTPDP